MMKISEMLVIKQPDLAQCLLRLNQLLEEGWQPYGSFFSDPRARYSETSGVFHTMVKYEQEDS